MALLAFSVGCKLCFLILDPFYLINTFFKLRDISVFGITRETLQRVDLCWQQWTLNSFNTGFPAAITFLSSINVCLGMWTSLLVAITLLSKSPKLTTNIYSGLFYTHSSALAVAGAVASLKLFFQVALLPVPMLSLIHATPFQLLRVNSPLICAWSRHFCEGVRSERHCNAPGCSSCPPPTYFALTCGPWPACAGAHLSGRHRARLHVGQSVARHGGVDTGRQQNAADDTCSAGSCFFVGVLMPHTPSTRFHLWITMRQHRGAKQSRTRGSRSQPPLGDTRKRQRHVKSRAVTTTHGTEKDALPALHLQNPIFWAPPCETDAERYHLLLVAVQDAKKWGEKCPHGWAVSIGPKGKHTAVPHKGRRAGGCWQGSSCWCCTQPRSGLTFSGSPWHFNQINVTEPRQAQGLWM